MRLDDSEVFEWWERVNLHRRLIDKSLYKLRHTTVFGWKRVFLQEIPNSTCYNYLATRGYECNRHGEILLTDEDFNQYQDLFQTFITMEET